MAARYQRQVGPARGLPSAGGVDFAGALDGVRQGLQQRASRNRMADVEQQGQREGLAGTAQPTAALTDAQRVYNAAAISGYRARITNEYRDRATRILAQHPERTPEALAQIEAKISGLSGGILSEVPEEFRPEFEAEAELRTSRVMAGVTAEVADATFRRDVDEVGKAIEADTEDAARFARDGDVEGFALASARVRARYDEMVRLGQITPGTAALAVERAEQGMQAEAIFGDFQRAGSKAAYLTQFQEAPDESLPLSVRDRLESRMQTIVRQERAEAQRAEALSALQSKRTSETIEYEMWRRIYVDGEAPPTPDEVDGLVQAGILRPDDARGVLKALSEPRKVQNDWNSVFEIEADLARGEDVGEDVISLFRAGKLEPDDARRLLDLNRERSVTGVKNPVAEIRRQTLDLLRVSGPYALVYKEGEQDLIAEGIRYFDRRMAQIPDGVDPEDHARTVSDELRKRVRRSRAEASESGLLVPIGGAFVDIDGVRMLDITGTKEALRERLDRGEIDTDRLDEELDLIARWESLDLAVR